MVSAPGVFTVRFDTWSGGASAHVSVDLGFGYWRREVRVRLVGSRATWVAMGTLTGRRIVGRLVKVSGGWSLYPTPEGTRPAYAYAAVLTAGRHDADNVVADIDLGVDAHLEGQAVRLDGCNARELGEPGGPEAAAAAAAMAPAGTGVLLTSLKTDKYGGRYVARVQLPDGRDLTGELIGAGWAARWNGRGTKPVPPWPLPTT